MISTALHSPVKTSKRMAARAVAALLLAVSLASPSSASSTRENINCNKPLYPPLLQNLVADRKPPSPLSPFHTRVAASSVVSLRRKRRTDTQEEEEEALSLSALVTTVAKKELKDCVLGIVADQGFQDSAVLEDLLRLPNLRQVRGRRRNSLANRI